MSKYPIAEALAPHKSTPWNSWSAGKREIVDQVIAYNIDHAGEAVISMYCLRNHLRESGYTATEPVIKRYCKAEHGRDWGTWD